MYTLQPGSDYDKKNPFHHFQKKKDMKKALSSFISMDSNTPSSSDYKIKICWFELENYQMVECK